MGSAEAGATAKEHNVVAKKKLVASGTVWLRRHFIGFLPRFLLLFRTGRLSRAVLTSQHRSTILAAPKSWTAAK
jgi:hypothetical protein